jgi:hypothetical protein
MVTAMFGLGAFALGVFIGLEFGPSTERLDAAYIDGYTAALEGNPDE